jgi:hypothetical protein
MTAAADAFGLPDDALRVAELFDKYFAPEPRVPTRVSPVYETSPIKRKRRGKEDVADFLHRIRGILAEQTYGITIRHLFYLLVTAKVIEKTETAYKNLIAHLSKWRRSGDIDFGAFVDGTRYWSGATLYDDAESALRECARSYRRNLWSQQPYYVEVWCEKDAIRSILLNAAEPFGVPVFAAKGFASLTSLHCAAQTFRQVARRGKRPVVLYFGDHDPSGLSGQAKAEQTLREQFGVAVQFRRLAVTAAQIVEFNLPTRPAKKTDSRAKGWEGECVEVDAMSSEVLVKLAEDAIGDMIDPYAWDQLTAVEQEERALLEQTAKVWKGVRR